jgi:hypothetical protein
LTYNLLLGRMLFKGSKMKTHTLKPHSKKKSSTKLKKLSVRKRVVKKKLPLDKDPFFSAQPVDLGPTNNNIIDEILYGKKSA